MKPATKREVEVWIKHRDGEPLLCVYLYEPKWEMPRGEEFVRYVPAPKRKRRRKG